MTASVADWRQPQMLLTLKKSLSPNRSSSRNLNSWAIINNRCRCSASKRPVHRPLHPCYTLRRLQVWSHLLRQMVHAWVVQVPPNKEETMACGQNLGPHSSLLTERSDIQLASTPTPSEAQRWLLIMLSEMRPNTVRVPRTARSNTLRCRYMP
jgi:hypothetical protein